MNMYYIFIEHEIVNMVIEVPATYLYQENMEVPPYELTNAIAVVDINWRISTFIFFTEN